MSEFCLVDLFCGCGGVSTGFEKAGFSTVIAIDCWDVALTTHEHNHPDTEHVKGSLRKDIDGRLLIEKIKNSVGETSKVHVHASPPCQDLSTINKSKKRTNDTGMTEWMVDLMMSFPKEWTWTIEQVNHKKVRELLASKPGVFFKVIDMWKYGVSQSRRRIIASNRDIFPILSTMQENAPFVEQIEIPENTVYIGNGNCTELRLNVNSPFVTHKKLDSEAWGYTIVSSFGYFLDENYKIIRSLNWRENAKLQTFPDDYFDKISETCKKKDLYKLIANAVPPTFAFKIAESVMSFYR